jgi:Secretion system C-terminal sorting domain
MKYAVLVITLLTVLNGFSQPVQSSVMFDKTWGAEAPNHIEFADETAEGDFILIGYRQELTTQNAGTDIYICKLDYQGNILWEKDIGYPYEIEQTLYVLKTKEETYLIAGLVSQISLTRLINIDKDSTILFDVILNNSPGLTSTPWDVSQAPDGGFFIGGVQGNNQIHYNTIIKVDAQGNEQWRQLNTDRAFYKLREIEATPDGGCLVAGIANGTYNYNTFIERLDANGNPLWYQYPYGVNDTIWNYPTEIFVFPDGSFNTYCGQPSADPNQRYSKLLKFRADGQLFDTLTHPFDIQFPFRGEAQIDSRTGAYVISNFPHPYINNFLCFIDPNGAVGAIVKYSDTYLPYTSLLYALRTKDGGFFAAGERNGKFWAVKFASDLRYQHSTISQTIQAYPNPTNTGIINLVFDLETDENLDLEIWSVNGKLILQDRFFCPAHSLNTYPVRFDLAGAGAGMYMLKVRSSQTTYFEKLIVDY